MSIAKRSRILVTVPAHNEEAYIGPCVERLYAALAGVDWDWKVVVSEDGSVDGTRSALARLQQVYPDLEVVSADRRLGRGLALRRLWAGRSEDIFVFLDADLASGTESLLAVVTAVLEGGHVVTGSRYAPGAAVHRPPLRSLVSLAYNSLLRLIFRDGIRDHQCGLKAFDRATISILLPQTVEDSWFWDTEALVIASRAGIEVQEIPISWTEPRASRTGLSRLARDIFLHGTRLLALLGRVEVASATVRTLVARAPGRAPRSLPSQAAPASSAL